MHIFENQLRLIVGNQPAFGNAKYIGRACIASLDGGTKLKAEFVTCGTADHYEAIKLTAINPLDGEIDRLLLRFEDYFKKHTIGASRVTPYIWTYNGQSQWYCEPTISEKVALGDAVQDYAELFEQQNEMSMTNIPYNIREMLSF